MRYQVADAPHIEVVLHSAGLACCAVEFTAAVTRGLLRPVVTDTEAASPSTTVLIVSGTLTTALAPALSMQWDALPAPKAALAFGACATSGGPYWDSYSVVPGAQDVVPMSHYVPGCPPRPEALVDAVRALAAEAT